MKKEIMIMKSHFRLLALLLALIMVLSACTTADPKETTNSTTEQTTEVTTVADTEATESETKEKSTTVEETTVDASEATETETQKSSETQKDPETTVAVTETSETESTETTVEETTSVTEDSSTVIENTDETTGVMGTEPPVEKKYDSSMSMSIDELRDMLTLSTGDFDEAHAKLEEFESAALEVTTAEAEEDETETGFSAEYEYVNAIYLEFEDMYFAIDTQLSIATLIYYYDMSDDEASALYLDAYSRFGDLYNAYVEVCKNVYENSQISAELFYDWTEEDIEELFGYDPETQKLREANEALQVELNDLPQDADYNNRSAEIYAQLVTNNNKLARLCGYENYYEYASVEVYGRDYGTEQLDLFSGYVSTYFKSNLDEMLKAFQDAYYDNITALGKTVFTSYIDKPFDKLSVNYLDLYIKSYAGTSTGEGFAHLFENKNVIFSSQENSHPSAFQTYVRGEGWDKPVCFFGVNGQDTSTIVHEMGHYYAALYNENVNSFDLAETQSQANEMLLLAFMKENMKGDGYEALKPYTMYNFMAQAVICVIIDDFERAVYSLDSVEGFSSKEFDDVMRSVCEKYGGADHINSEITDVFYYWRQVATNNPVYYISYAVSMVEAMNVFAIADEDPAAAREVYRKLVEESTENDTLLTAAERAGLSSPFDEETFKAIIAAILGEEN